MRLSLEQPADLNEPAPALLPDAGADMNRKLRGIKKCGTETKDKNAKQKSQSHQHKYELKLAHDVTLEIHHDWIKHATPQIYTMDILPNCAQRSNITQGITHHRRIKVLDHRET